MRTLVLGGNGNFGTRICRALAGDEHHRVVAAGRNPRRGAQIAMLDAGVQHARLDREAPTFPIELARLEPDLVIHCAGPFQGQDYRVARAAIAAGAHYLDLADCRTFVSGFSQHLDATARAAKVLAVSGASSVPGLSSAVADALAMRLRSVRGISVAIAPGQRTPRGAATVAGVLSYAGRPFGWWRDGAWTEVHGWQHLRRLRFTGLGHRWAAACDVPDLELFPERYRTVMTVEFRAALELTVQMLALWILASVRRSGWPISIERWAPALDRLSGWMNRFGGERGAMLVCLDGIRRDGKEGRVEWHLTAESNHGPEVPCMPAILLAHQLARGEIALRGALPCLGLLTLKDFEPEFRRWNITTCIEEHMA